MIVELIDEMHKKPSPTWWQGKDDSNLKEKWRKDYEEKLTLFPYNYKTLNKRKTNNQNKIK